MGLSAGAIVAAVIGAGAQAYSADKQRKTTHQQMDAQREAEAKAAVKPTQDANAALALRRKALAENSLLTGGSMGATAAPAQGILGGGKPTLG